MRPSSRFVKLASSFQSERSWVSLWGDKANGKSSPEHDELGRGAWHNARPRGGPDACEVIEPWPSWWRPDFTWTKREPEPILEGFPAGTTPGSCPRPRSAMRSSGFRKSGAMPFLRGEDGE